MRNFTALNFKKLQKKNKLNFSEREVIPNCLAERGVHRYQLHNYRHYCGNKITTAKYTLLTFIPKNLWEQVYEYFLIFFSLRKKFHE